MLRGPVIEKTAGHEAARAVIARVLSRGAEMVSASGRKLLVACTDDRGLMTMENLRGFLTQDLSAAARTATSLRDLEACLARDGDLVRFSLDRNPWVSHVLTPILYAPARTPDVARLLATDDYLSEGRTPEDFTGADLEREARLFHALGAVRMLYHHIIRCPAARRAMLS